MQAVSRNRNDIRVRHITIICNFLYHFCSVSCEVYRSSGSCVILDVYRCISLHNVMRCYADIKF